jgi:hypothetical protein
MISWEQNQGELTAQHSGFVGVTKQHDKHMTMITLYHTDTTKNVTHRGKAKLKPTIPMRWITTWGGELWGLFKQSAPADFP